MTNPAVQPAVQPADTAAPPHTRRSPTRALRRHRRVRGTLAAVVTGAVLVAACGGDDGASSPTATTAAPATDPTATTASTASITLVAYDSFPVGGTAIGAALDEFTADTGIEVTVLSAGDTGTMIAKAALTAGNPEGDVLWGVDTTFLSRALDADVFEPYTATGADELPSALRDLAPGGEVTPVNFGDVCVNVDLGYFAAADLPLPTSLEDLTDPAYRDLLVVQNPATSSPGLAFVLATIAHFGEEAWLGYWEDLRANGVAVSDGWTEAYYDRSTWAGGGDRPLVVSYGSSPPAEVVFADPPRDDAPTGVIESTCFRQVEFAGVLRGTSEPDAARALVDFLISERFQSELALELFVYPVNPDVALPEVFTAHAVVPDTPRSVDPDRIDDRRADWIDAWTDAVLG